LEIPRAASNRGAIYEGLFEMSIDGDLDKIAGLSGATFHINAYGIHGRGLSTFNIFNSSISRVGSIEARPSVRLYEAWAEQVLFGGTASIRWSIGGGYRILH
jgi:porin